MTCQECPSRPKCRRICKHINKILRACGIKSAFWIRPRLSTRLDHRYREIPFSALSRNKDGDIIRRDE